MFDRSRALLAGLIDENEVEGLLSLVEAKLRKLHFNQSQSSLKSVHEMLMSHYLYNDCNPSVLKTVRNRTQFSLLFLF